MNAEEQNNIANQKVNESKPKRSLDIKSLNIGILICLCGVLLVDSASGQRGSVPDWNIFRSGTPEQVKGVIANWRSKGGVNAEDASHQTPLIAAAAKNPNPEVIAALLEAGADLEARDDKGWTPLMYAAAANPSPEVVSALLKAGAEIEATEVDEKEFKRIGTTFLRANQAYAEGLELMGGTKSNKWKVRLTRALRDYEAAASQKIQGISRNFRLISLFRASHICEIMTEHYSKVKGSLYIKYKDKNESIKQEFAASLDEFVDEDGRLSLPGRVGETPLILAAKHNSPEVIEVLLKGGADVNAGDKTGRTPLMYAAAANPSPEVVSALLKAGADVEARAPSTGGSTNALTIGDLDDQMVHDGESFVFEGQARYSSFVGPTPLMIAVKNNSDFEIITALIKGGADVNARAADMTPLMIAVKNNSHSQVITALLKGGAELEARSEDGLTPLMYAADNNASPEVITALVKGGARVNAMDKKGMTPLMYAAAKTSSPEVIKALLKGGAKVNAKDEMRRTPLSYATERNTSSAVITTLREAGAELGDAIKVVSARQLFNDYRDNEIKAKLDYTGKELLVTGAVVREIGRRRDSRMFVELTAGFTCYFLTDQEYELAKLKKGDTISIKGECIGSHKDFRLEGCSVQR